MAKRIYTIGHSNRSLDQFLRLLRLYGIDAVIDVRRFPTSRKVPHFKREHLEEALRKAGVKYYWLGDLLGGFRPGGYENYMATEGFAKGLRRLLEIVDSHERPAIMCRERLWFRCHRRFISDELVKLGYEVIHIIEAGETRVHRARR